MLRIALALFLLPTLAVAQATSQDRRPSHCIAIADAFPGEARVWQANWSEPLEEYTVRITYIDHSMFLIQSEGGIEVVTDYNGFVGDSAFVPDVVTMNNAHGSHWTANPDPRIPLVLEGWTWEGVPADHHHDMGEMLIRNVTTDIRSPWGDGRADDGNSIFIFEVAGLCIGHLGHLHHEPSDEQYAAIGRLDVVMAAVDGGLTLDTPTMLRVLKRLRSSVILPMHWFGFSSLDAFLTGMSEDYAISRTPGHSIEVSLRTLPDVPTIHVLDPQFLQYGE
ncbi:MAG: MBL fold metallo-hydrolase [Pseudomonadota bacterium]